MQHEVGELITVEKEGDALKGVYQRLYGAGGIYEQIHADAQIIGQDNYRRIQWEQNAALLLAVGLFKNGLSYKLKVTETGPYGKKVQIDTLFPHTVKTMLIASWDLCVEKGLDCGSYILQDMALSLGALSVATKMNYDIRAVVN